MCAAISLGFAKLTCSKLFRATHLFVTRGNVTGLIEGLIRDGLVRRVGRPTDRRAHGLKLTSKGSALVDEYLPHHRGALAALNAGLTADESLQLAGLLHKLRSGMQAPEPPSRS